MKNQLPAALAAALLLVACNQTPTAPKPKTDEEKTVYALGVAVQESLKPFAFTPAELELVISGLRDSAAGKAEIKVADKQMDIQKLALARQAAQAAEGSKKGVEYQEKAAKEPGAVKTASGLIFVPVKEGTGPSPVATDKVKVHYTGKLIDGTVFDSSVTRGSPVTFPLAGVIACWTEGVQKIKVGGKGRLVCPAAIAYGDRSPPGSAIPPGSTLDFEVELLEIVK